MKQAPFWTPQETAMKSLFQCFMRDQSGATAIEYGLIAAGISVAIIAVVNSLGVTLTNTFTTVSTQPGTAGKLCSRPARHRSCAAVLRRGSPAAACADPGAGSRAFLRVISS